MRSLILKLSMAAAFLTGSLLAPCDGQITLGWVPSATPGVASYNLCWGIGSGVYTFTNTYPGTQTNGTMTDLVANQVYFVAVQAVSSAGLVSPFSNEVSVTNNPSPANEPPSPIFVTSTNGGGGSPVVSGNGGASSGGDTAAPATSAANFWGVPPFLTMTVSNGQPDLNIAGTVGATLRIEGTTNPYSLDRWDTITNVTLTTVAPVAQTNQASTSQNVLDLAFVPAAQKVPLTPGNSTSFQLFRAVMPYDYMILASIVLTGRGYTPRLILVNMPGAVCDDACYVSEAAGFIHYNRTNSALQLQSCRPSIRQIANTLANSLEVNWTSASEFTFSNGLGQILATVVETEPPSFDPVAGDDPPGPLMVIDY